MFEGSNERMLGKKLGAMFVAYLLETHIKEFNEEDVSPISLETVKYTARNLAGLSNDTVDAAIDMMRNGTYWTANNFLTDEAERLHNKITEEMKNASG